MYPFMQLDDRTEIVHSEILDGERVKICIEKPVENGFQSATCFLPKYEWGDIVGFDEKDIERFQEIIESTSHLIIRFAKEGGFDNASSF